MTREKFILKHGLLPEEVFITRFQTDSEFFDDVMNWQCHPGGEKTERLSFAKDTTEEELKIFLDDLGLS